MMIALAERNNNNNNNIMKQMKLLSDTDIRKV